MALSSSMICCKCINKTGIEPVAIAQKSAIFTTRLIGQFIYALRVHICNTCAHRSFKKTAVFKDHLSREKTKAK